ncbi:MAG TPA: phage holin family protein [Pyrinomonadaceae bacterium]|nr:phage holin family protein [Pyrinomonadaceae bacterium]
MSASRQSLANADDAAITRSDNERALTNGNNETLPNLLGRLGDDVMQLINSQLALFKVEMKEEANTFARNAGMIAFGAGVAAIGFALVNVAIALGVSTLFASAGFSQPASYALGFIVTGAFYLLVGGILILVMKNRLAKQQLVPPRTVQELRKDKQWLKSEL